MSSRTAIVSAARIFCLQLSVRSSRSFQGLEDGLAALVQLGELLQAVADGGDGHLVQRARDLLAVAGDEGHRGPLVEKGGNCLDLAGRQTELAGDLCDVEILHEYLLMRFKKEKIPLDPPFLQRGRPMLPPLKKEGWGGF